MKTISASRVVSLLLSSIAVAMLTPASSFAQNSGEKPVVSITGPSKVLEYCPPNADCISLGFTLRRTGPGLDQPLTVFLRYLGTATAGADYVAFPAQVTFEAGRELATVQSTPVDDSLFEGDETVTTQIMVGLNYGADLEHWEATTVLIDDDPVAPPIVGVELITREAGETSPFQNAIFWAEFRVTRTGPATNELVVYLTTAGMARLGEDYRLEPSNNGLSVCLLSGARSVNVRLYPIDDEIYEGNESAIVSLIQPPTGSPVRFYDIDPARASVAMVIRDNDPAVASLRMTAPREGEEFMEGVDIPISVVAVDARGAITHVEFFADGVRIGESIINFIRQPDPGTPIEHEFLWRGAPVGPHILTARAVDAAGAPVESAPVRIYVNAGSPLVSIRATQPFTAEPCPVCFVAPGVFTISRTGKTNEALAVWYLLGGTAQNGVDYAKLSGEVVIPAGSNSVQVVVLPILDDVREGDETVVAQLIVPPVAAPVDPYRIDPEHGRATVLIRDSFTTPPGPAVVSISAPDAFAREGTNQNSSVSGINTASFLVRRAGRTNEPLAVRFSVGGTASNGMDYVTLSSPVVIPAGQFTARLVVRPIDDGRPELTETMVVTLLADDSATPAYQVGTARRAAVVIADNDKPRPKCCRLPDGRFNLCLPTDATHCYRVEVSEDCKIWTAVCTVPVNEGMAQFVDPDEDNASRRFYRLVPVACDAEE